MFEPFIWFHALIRAIFIHVILGVYRTGIGLQSQSIGIIPKSQASRPSVSSNDILLCIVTACCFALPESINLDLVHHSLQEVAHMRLITSFCSSVAITWPQLVASEFYPMKFRSYQAYPCLTCGIYVPRFYSSLTHHVPSLAFFNLNTHSTHVRHFIFVWNIVSHSYRISLEMQSYSTAYLT